MGGVFAEGDEEIEGTRQNTSTVEGIVGEGFARVGYLDAQVDLVVTVSVDEFGAISGL